MREFTIHNGSEGEKEQPEAQAAAIINNLRQRFAALDEPSPLPLDAKGKSEKLRSLSELRSELQEVLTNNHEVWKPTQLYFTTGREGDAEEPANSPALRRLNEIRAAADTALHSAVKPGERFYDAASAVGVSSNPSECSHGVLVITPEFFNDDAQFGAVIDQLVALQEAHKPIMVLWLAPQAELDKYNDSGMEEGMFKKLAKRLGDDAIRTFPKINAVRVATDGAVSAEQTAQIIINEFTRRARVQADDFSFVEASEANALMAGRETSATPRPDIFKRSEGVDLQGEWQALSLEIIKLQKAVLKVNNPEAVRNLLEQVAALREQLRDALKKNGMPFHFISYRSTRGPIMARFCDLLSSHLGTQMSIDQKALFRGPSENIKPSKSVSKLARFNFSTSGGMANWTEVLAKEIDRSTAGIVCLDNTFFKNPKQVIREVSQMVRLGLPITYMLLDAPAVRTTFAAQFAELKKNASTTLANLRDYAGEPVDIEKVLGALEPYFKEPPEKPALMPEVDAAGTDFTAAGQETILHFFKTGEMETLTDRFGRRSADKGLVRRPIDLAARGSSPFRGRGAIRGEEEPVIRKPIDFPKPDDDDHFGGRGGGRGGRGGGTRGL